MTQYKLYGILLAMSDGKLPDFSFTTAGGTAFGPVGAAGGFILDKLVGAGANHLAGRIFDQGSQYGTSFSGEAIQHRNNDLSQLSNSPQTMALSNAMHLKNEKELIRERAAAQILVDNNRLAHSSNNPAIQYNHNPDNFIPHVNPQPIPDNYPPIPGS